uniref:Uncharacterized protein n=1 Tax=Calidris pygmaea TaxID=425635 RepID=A0A8C3KLS0_9CHAR
MLSKDLGLCYIQPLQNCISAQLSSTKSVDQGLAQAIYWKLILAYIPCISSKFKRDD